MSNSSRRPDVLHVTTVHSAFDSRIFYREALTAKDAGFATVVVGPAERAEIRCGISVVPIVKYRVRFVRRILGPMAALRKILDLRPRIVHIHDPELIPIALLLKLIGYRVVWDVHEYYSEIIRSTASPGVSRDIKVALANIFVEKLPTMMFDRSVFPTNALRSVIRKNHKTTACVNLLPRAAFPKIRGVNEKCFDIIFMGSMSPFRAAPFMDMVKYVLDRYDGLRVAMLGVSESTQSWMRTHAPSRSVLDSITFIPRVPHAEVANILRKARLGFNYHPMQRRFEVAIPMKVYEYMACGLPVVCSRFPELASQFSDKELYFVDGDDQGLYGEAVLNLLHNEMLAARLGLAGETAVRERLNWEASEAPKLTRLYQELLKGEL
jgi:glycosyltransferase involved in cell wall biosynthesis